MEEPTRFQAGLTLTWTKPLAAYPSSDGWALYYSLRRPNAEPLSFTAPAVNGLFTVSVPPSVTANWPAGSYKLFGWVTNGDDKRQVYVGNLDVLPDPTGDTQYDPRGKWTKIVALLEDYLENKITKSQLDVRAQAIGAITAQYSTLQDIRDFYGFACQQRESELERERIESGQPTQRDILITF